MQVERSEILALLRACHIFKALTDEDLEKVADPIEAYLFAENQTIFEQKSEADAFYFILSGRVALKWRRHKRVDEEIREAQDYFGEEALAAKPIARRGTATAQSATIVLRLSREALQALRQTFPALAHPLRLVLNSYLLAVSVKLDWLGPRENLHFITRRHWIFLLRKLLPVFIIDGLAVSGSAYLAVVVAPQAIYSLGLFILFLLIGLVWLVWTAVDWSNDYAIITNRRVVFLEKTLLMYDSRQEVPLDAILADDLITSQFGRWIGYGSIFIRTYTGQVILDGLARPELVIHLLKALREQKKISHKREERESIDRAIRQRLGYLTADEPGDIPPAPPAQSGFSVFQHWLSELILLRVERDGIVTFRTHWFIMLKKTWLPLLFMIAAFVLLLLDVINIVSLPPAIALLIILAAGPLLFLWFLYQFVDWRNDRYLITPEMIIDVDKKPLGTEKRKSAPLRNILSVDYERKGIIGLVLDFGTVYIRVGDSTFTFDNVLNPAEVQRELFQHLMDYKHREEQKMELAQREQLADWIELYHRAIQEGKPPEKPDEEEPNSG